MTTHPSDWATKVAAEIAAEKRAANPASASDSIETMRVAAIRREAARRGAADDTVFTILRSLMTVNADGDLVERETGKTMDQFLDEMQGTNPAYFGKAASTQSPVTTGPNPFKRGSGYSVTAQMILWRDQPELAHQLAAEADFQPGAR